MKTEFLIQPSGALSGEIFIPGDKSISHRAAMFSAIAQGTTYIENFLNGDDCLATVKALQAMGVTILQPTATSLEVRGVGMHGLQPTTSLLDMGNSGTSIRLLTGLLAAQKFSSRLAGDASLNQRPMLRVAKPLIQMGANIQLTEQQFAPIQIQPSKALHAINYSLPMASAQVKSAILLAALYADGLTTITEPAASRDHSERMLQTMGVALTRDQNQIQLQGPQSLKATQIKVPGDISSAAFFMVAATLVPGSHLILRQVGINPTRLGIVKILQQMGAQITLLNEQMFGAEPVADMVVKASALRGIHIDPALVPSAIDEFPILMIAALHAQGETLISGAQELRYKESDRLTTMAKGIEQLGGCVQLREDGALISGEQTLQGGVIDSHHDHRIAMSFAVAGLLAAGPIQIKNADKVATSFPNFVELAQACGFNLEEK